MVSSIPSEVGISPFHYKMVTLANTLAFVVALIGIIALCKIPTIGTIGSSCMIAIGIITGGILMRYLCRTYSAKEIGMPLPTNTFPVIVKTNKENYSYDVTAKTTVDELKRKVNDDTGIVIDQISLKLYDRELSNNDAHLVDYGVRQQSELQVYLKLRVPLNPSFG